MADQKVSNLPALNGADVDSADLLYIVDSSAGTAGSKKITIGQYQLAPYSAATANTVVYFNGTKVPTSSSALTFDGTNLGIGTSSPGEKLAINQGNIYALRTGGAKLRLADQNNEVSVESLPVGANSDMVFKTSTTTRMTLDSSGNLGLGVTPSAWSGAALELQTGAALYGFADTTNVAQNAYYNAGWKYKATAAAAIAQAARGAHYWFTAPSGTAGNAITFTQAMTLDANGDFLIGTTTAPANGANTRNVVFNNPNSVSTYVKVSNASTGSTAADGFDLIMGTSSDAYLYNRENGPMIFGTNNTERARITSGGDLLVGTTTLSDVGNSIFGSSVPGVIHQNNNAASNGFVFTSYRRSSVEIGSVSQNGTTAVLYNTTSDRRLKDNIVPAPSASDVIDAIQIVSHGWKSAPDEQVKYGVIAQDLHAVAPQAVLQGDDGDEIEKTWGVDYSKLVPMLIKEIQSLRARVAALEAK